MNKEYYTQEIKLQKEADELYEMLLNNSASGSPVNEKESLLTDLGKIVKQEPVKKQEIEDYELLLLKKTINQEPVKKPVKKQVKKYVKQENDDYVSLLSASEQPVYDLGKTIKKQVKKQVKQEPLKENEDEDFYYLLSGVKSSQ